MSKVKIQLVLLGHIPHKFDLKKICKWESDLFEIVGKEQTYEITSDSNGYSWEYLDTIIEKELPQKNKCDVVLAITNIPLEQNYYARRFSNDRICLTYREMSEILTSNDIPLENLTLRVLYALSIVYKSYGNRIPLMTEGTNFAHDETRGCIFDMNGIKYDVIYSLNKPILCPACVNKYTREGINKLDKNLISSIQSELKKIKKPFFYSAIDFIKRRPIISFFLTSMIALVIGVLSSIIATFIIMCFSAH